MEDIQWVGKMIYPLATKMSNEELKPYKLDEEIIRSFEENFRHEQLINTLAFQGKEKRALMDVLRDSYERAMRENMRLAVW